MNHSEVSRHHLMITFKRNRFNVVLSSDPSISELSDPTKLSQLLEETSRLRGFVEEIDR